MRDLEPIYSHTFEDYDKRLNDRPRTFISKTDAISSNPTIMDWSAEDQDLRNRTTRKKFL